MTFKDELKMLVSSLTEEQASLVLKIIYQYKSEDQIDKNGEVIIDSFYQKMIDRIDESDNGISYSKDELMKELGI